MEPLKLDTDRIARRQKTGGRQKGTPNKRTASIVDATTAIAEFAEGRSPLAIMLIAMNKAMEDDDLKLAAAIAKDAAPYCHPRLTSIEHSGELNVDLSAKIAEARKRG